jgi:hypothetical protein
METAKLFAGDVAFHDAEEVLTFLAGGSDRAGFVQVIQGRTTDPERMTAMLQQGSAELAEMRPDVIGGIVASYGDGEFTQAVYFTSEAEARAGERRDQFQQRYTNEMAPALRDLRYFDLREPWLYSRG